MREDEIKKIVKVLQTFKHPDGGWQYVGHHDEALAEHLIDNEIGTSTRFELGRKFHSLS